jgi:protein tyrosine/serine phosphatase
MTQPAVLHLDWPNCLNARDLGGLPTADGGQIRERALIRTDSHGKLTDEGVAAVHAYGVSRIIDLRRERECDVSPSPFAGTPLYCHLPVQNPADPDNETLTLAEIYMAMLDARPQLFAAALGAIADAPTGGVAVHCAGGKDRTGVVVAMALTLCDVDREIIASDYALTEARLAAESAAYLETVADPARREQVRRLQPTPPSTMFATLEHLDRAYGGVEAYLVAGGFTVAHGKALRDRLRN